MVYEIKCRQCRMLITQNKHEEKQYLNCHGILIMNQEENSGCSSDTNLIFLEEGHLPEWMKVRIEEEQWTKGRLNCPKCDSRIGAFDFVSGVKCDCNKCNLPSVHIIKSKLDIVILQ